MKTFGDKYNNRFFSDYDEKLRKEFDTSGILILSDFVSAEALDALQREATALKSVAYRSKSDYNVYILPQDPTLPQDSVRNKRFATTKGCVADDQIPRNSILRNIYDSKAFRAFLSKLQRIPAVFPYGDTLSSININYYDPGDSLEWHYDNADFALTLLLNKPEKGGIYEYVPNRRYADNGTEDYGAVAAILDGKIEPERVSVGEGSLMIFRGNRSLHRVTEVESGNRVLVTLNYNLKPGISLSEESRATFFGRLT